MSSCYSVHHTHAMTTTTSQSNQTDKASLSVDVIAPRPQSTLRCATPRRSVRLLPHLDRLIATPGKQPRPRPIKRRRHDTRLCVQGARLRYVLD